MAEQILERDQEPRTRDLKRSSSNWDDSSWASSPDPLAVGLLYTHTEEYQKALLQSDADEHGENAPREYTNGPINTLLPIG